MLAGLRNRLRRLGYAFNRWATHFHHTLAILGKVLGALAFVAAIMCIVAGTVFVGFDLSADDGKLLMRMMRIAQIIFIVKILYGWIFTWRDTRRDTRLVKWIADITLMLTLMPLIYPHPENPWIPWLEKILYDRTFIFSIVGIYSVVEFSYGITRILDRRINPTMMLATSFIFFIIIGSFILMMPRCTVSGIGYVDSLFVSTSAVCITGLCPVDVSSTFTPFGILILSLLIQIGGLGVMTFTSFFALFFSGNTSIYSQLAVKDMIYSKSINSLLPTLLYILGFTLVIEAIGAVGIFLCVHGTLGMSLEDELIFSGFHALSAFCNAGFSNIEGGMSNPALLHSNQIVYLVASALIFAGGIGFPILVNFKSAVAERIKWLWRKLRHAGRGNIPVHLYDMNTKLAMTTTTLIFILSAVLFFVFEFDNSLAGMSLYDKVVQSVFNAFVPRSSGFSSVNPAGFLNITIIMMIVLMWIGGGSQSTAGGVKVNTIAVLWLQMRAAIRGSKDVVAYNRTVAPESIRRAMSVVTVSIIAFTVYTMVLVGLEPTLPVKDLVFESASALFTVGSSLGVTDRLSDISKIVVSTAMFLGRVGLLSLLIGLAARHKVDPISYPTDNVIIN